MDDNTQDPIQLDQDAWDAAVVQKLVNTPKDRLAAFVEAANALPSPKQNIPGSKEPGVRSDK